MDRKDHQIDIPQKYFDGIKLILRFQLSDLEWDYAHQENTGYANSLLHSN